ncbi:MULTISPECIES: hypothetical protein [unclassified Legionella]|uniref:hypothetical protein n=1 Tax=unclassified Legionella TaxID=2622702 RepID=UPI00105699BF|nr:MULTISPECIES: hypothetical protein [unclassified Legionella]MDI9818089.1 hypothetical protein [Legionella sp. PL877]
MLNKSIVTSLSAICISISMTAHAEYDFSCKAEVAVATPPVPLTHNVAFNITAVDNTGTNKSITLKGGSAPQLIENIACFSTYTISATDYETSPNMKRGTPIGQCILNAGAVTFNYPADSISVVFPKDFTCNQ